MWKPTLGYGTYLAPTPIQPHQLTGAARAMTLVSTKEGEVSSSDRQTSCKDHSTSLASDGIM